MIRLSLTSRRLAYSKYDIALFIKAKGKTRWSELLREFVENNKDKHITRQTLSNYLKQLREERLISKTVDPKILAVLHIIRPIYKVSKSGEKRLQEIANKKRIYEFLESANPEDVKRLTEVVDHLMKD